MGMVAPGRIWTVEEVRALPDDGNRYEVVGGELLVTPAPSWRHQRAIRTLAFLLHEHVTSHKIGAVLFAPGDVELEGETLVQPDLFVIPLVDGREPEGWHEVRQLLLVVEILSPTTARADRLVKRRLYQRERVPEYWIVDVDARLVERWRPDDERPELLAERVEWQPDASHPGLAIDLPAYFEEVAGG